MALTDKQQAFVDEYMIDMNASAAAERAGYSKKTAGAIGHENLKKPKIQEALQVAMDARSKRTEITADRVLNALAEIAYADPEDEKTNDRLKGLELLGKHLVLFSDRVVHDGEIITKVERTIVDP